MSEKENHFQKAGLSVPWYGYVALLFAIVFFSGAFSSTKWPLSVLDFGQLAGKFGSVMGVNGKAATFSVQGELAARLLSEDTGCRS